MKNLSTKGIKRKESKIWLNDFLFLNGMQRIDIEKFLELTKEYILTSLQENEVCRINKLGTFSIKRTRDPNNYTNKTIKLKFTPYKSLNKLLIKRRGL